MAFEPSISNLGKDRNVSHGDGCGTKREEKLIQTLRLKTQGGTRQIQIQGYAHLGKLNELGNT